VLVVAVGAGSGVRDDEGPGASHNPGAFVVALSQAVCPLTGKLNYNLKQWGVKGCPRKPPATTIWLPTVPSVTSLREALHGRRQRWTRDPWTVTLAALTAYRITRLVTTDDLPPAVRLRQWLTQRTPDEYAMLWSCPWCFGFWTSGAVAGLAELADRRGHRDLFLLAAMPWALSTVAGMLAEREVA